MMCCALLSWRCSANGQTARWGRDFNNFGSVPAPGSPFFATPSCEALNILLQNRRIFRAIKYGPLVNVADERSVLSHSGGKHVIRESSHPTILILQLGSEDEHPFTQMEWCSGTGANLGQQREFMFWQIAKCGGKYLISIFDNNNNTVTAMIYNNDIIQSFDAKAVGTLTFVCCSRNTPLDLPSAPLRFRQRNTRPTWTQFSPTDSSTCSKWSTWWP